MDHSLKFSFEWFLIITPKQKLVLIVGKNFQYPQVLQALRLNLLALLTGTLLIELRFEWIIRATLQDEKL